MAMELAENRHDPSGISSSSVRTKAPSTGCSAVSGTTARMRRRASSLAATHSSAKARCTLRPSVCQGLRTKPRGVVPTNKSVDRLKSRVSATSTTMETGRTFSKKAVALFDTG